MMVDSTCKISEKSKEKKLFYAKILTDYFRSVRIFIFHLLFFFSNSTFRQRFTFDSERNIIYWACLYHEIRGNDRFIASKRYILKICLAWCVCFCVFIDVGICDFIRERLNQTKKIQNKRTNSTKSIENCILVTAEWWTNE